VARENRPMCASEAARRRVLRAGVLRLGELLGLDRHQVIRVAEAITGRPWRRCRCADLERVVGEYCAIVDRVMARQRSASVGEVERNTHARAA
jgi:hypothetical protein